MMHAGPFANIDHGNTSLIADLLAMKLSEYVFTESGFGSAWNGEVLRHRLPQRRMGPSAVVLVTTVRAVKHHGGLATTTRAASAKSARQRSRPESRT